MRKDPATADARRLIEEADRGLLRELDEECARGARQAVVRLACRLGCTACCIGVFDITALDGWRLRRGLELLRAGDPEAAAAVVARAAGQWRALVAGFPGDRDRRTLGCEEAREQLFAAHDRLPCPVLDPGTGACLLYAHRPLSCRTYGLPVRNVDGVLPPCPLNFGGASDGSAVAAATIAPDPGDREGGLLNDLAGLGLEGETIVAAALAPDEDG